MTDGPHKSLPMNRAWKRVAKNLANPNASHAEVSDLVCEALLTSERRTCIDRIRKILAPEAQGSLLLGDSATLLAGLGALNSAPPSSFARNVMDYCAARLQAGRDNFEVLRGAVAYALRSETESHFRGIAEHWLREAPKAARAMRLRCAETDSSMDYRVVSDLALSLGRSARPVAARRKTELSDGVPL